MRWAFSAFSTSHHDGNLRIVALLLYLVVWSVLFRHTNVQHNQPCYGRYIGMCFISSNAAFTKMQWHFSHWRLFLFSRRIFDLDTCHSPPADRVLQHLPSLLRAAKWFCFRSNRRSSWREQQEKVCTQQKKSSRVQYSILRPLLILLHLLLLPTDVLRSVRPKGAIPTSIWTLHRREIDISCECAVVSYSSRVKCYFPRPLLTLLQNHCNCYVFSHSIYVLPSAAL